MSATATTTFKPLSMADSCLLLLPSIFTSKPHHQYLSIPPKSVVKFQLSSCCYFLSPLTKKPTSQFSSIVPFVAQTSDWAQQEEDNNTTIAIADSEQEEDNNTTIAIADSEQEEGNWEGQESDGIEARLSDWEAEGEEESIGGEGESGGEEESVGFSEPPEEAKIFVGNLPYDVDSQKLAMLFERAGTVEIAEVIYNRETDTSRGFGFVTMSTVEEAEKAVDMFHRYDLDGRLLTVNKAAPRGARPERPPRVYEPAFRIYVGNLPWDVDNARLEQVFSEHGKVVDARVVYDRETGRSRGFGFVTMSTETELNDAIAALDGQSMEGRAIRVNVAEERPRRGGF